MCCAVEQVTESMHVVLQHQLLTTSVLASRQQHEADAHRILDCLLLVLTQIWSVFESVSFAAWVVVMVRRASKSCQCDAVGLHATIYCVIYVGRDDIRRPPPRHTVQMRVVHKQCRGPPLL